MTFLIPTLPIFFDLPHQHGSPCPRIPFQFLQIFHQANPQRVLIFFIRISGAAKARNETKILAYRVICVSVRNSPAVFMKPRTTP